MPDRCCRPVRSLDLWVRSVGRRQLVDDAAEEILDAWNSLAMEVEGFMRLSPCPDAGCGMAEWTTQ